MIYSKDRAGVYLHDFCLSLKTALWRTQTITYIRVWFRGGTNNGSSCLGQAVPSAALAGCSAAPLGLRWPGLCCGMRSGVRAAGCRQTRTQSSRQKRSGRWTFSPGQVKSRMVRGSLTWARLASWPRTRLGCSADPADLLWGSLVPGHVRGPWQSFFFFFFVFFP